MHCWIFVDTQFIAPEAALAAANDPSKYNSTIIKIVNVCLLNPDIYTVFCLFIKYLQMFVISLILLVS